jgi:hypothetical protein
MAAEDAVDMNAPHQESVKSTICTATNHATPDYKGLSFVLCGRVIMARRKNLPRRQSMKALTHCAMAALLMAVLAFPLTAQQPTPKNGFMPTTQDRDDNKEGREHHPHLRSAIHELQEAKRELQTASRDFGGHRADAVKACDEAIHQLQLALQYDKK